MLQRELAVELGVRRPSLSDFEVYGKPLPRGIPPAEVIAAIERIAERKRRGQ